MWRNFLAIGLFLALAFGGEFLVIQATRGLHPNVVLDFLPYVVFFSGLGLAFWVARRAHQRREFGKPAGIYCANCRYDLTGTPDRCPECGAVGTAKAFIPLSKTEAIAHAVFDFLGVVFVALLAAAAIMIHVQLLNSPPSGH